MTKAKTPKGAGDSKKADAKPAKAKKDDAGAVAAKPAKASEKAAAKPAPKKPAKDRKPAGKSGDTEIIVKSVSPEPPRPMGGFANSGLGVKTTGRKPALSVAPGVMILGRSSQAKPEQAQRPSERRLSKKDLADIKNFLVEKRERLLAGMRRELAMQRERAESKAADEVDKATDAYDEDLSFEIAAANDQELGEIQVALEKIDKGTYGECEICGCAISPSRLKILPSATTCVSCRGQEELSRRRDDGQALFPSMLEDEGLDGEGL